VTETNALAAALLAAGILLATAALLGRTSRRTGLPLVLLFLALGMLAGSEGIGRIEFEDYRLAFRLGSVALVLILFDGGLNVPLEVARRFAAPALALATVGVLGTLAAVGAAAHLLFGVPWGYALLLGACVSSTDVAALLAALRSSRLQLREPVGATLELESGLNDPMAVIATLAVTGSLVSGEPIGWSTALSVAIQLGVGGAMGVVLGLGAAHLLARVSLPAVGLYPVLTVGAACAIFGLTTLLQGSGFLAVYLAGIVIGRQRLPYRAGLLRVHDAFGWLAQVTMFLMLGLLVFPSRLVGVAGPGIALGLLLAFVGRPLVVLLTLLPFGFSMRERLFLGWAGLRGAVPIVLATIPVLAGVHQGTRVFDVVFFVVVVAAFLPGMTIGPVSRWLGVVSPAPPPPQASLEMTSLVPTERQVEAFRVEEGAPVAGRSLDQLEFPAGANVMVMLRGPSLLPARGDSQLASGDWVYVLCRPEEVDRIGAMFRRAEGG
jgi:cell volume regulation protein A